MMYVVHESRKSYHRCRGGICQRGSYSKTIRASHSVAGSRERWYQISRHDNDEPEVMMVVT